MRNDIGLGPVHVTRPPATKGSNEMAEEWRIVKSFSKYEVSNNGVVRHRRTLQLVTSYVDRFGYPRVQLYFDKKMGSKKRKWVRIHRLVADAFIENIGHAIVHHRNGIRYDNSIENLTWTASRENSKFRWLQFTTFKRLMKDILEGVKNGLSEEEIYVLLRKQYDKSEGNP
ncbi:MAG: HNH endonuclease [Syntrophales bacterium]|nr:HNH endonuclease [Syntrophales bacterium]